MGEPGLVCTSCSRVLCELQQCFVWHTWLWLRFWLWRTPAWEVEVEIGHIRIHLYGATITASRPYKSLPAARTDHRQPPILSIVHISRYSPPTASRPVGGQPSARLTGPGCQRPQRSSRLLSTQYATTGSTVQPYELPSSYLKLLPPVFMLLLHHAVSQAGCGSEFYRPDQRSHPRTRLISVLMAEKPSEDSRTQAVPLKFSVSSPYYTPSESNPAGGQ